MRLIFHQSLPCDPHISAISVSVFESRRPKKKKKSNVDMTSSYDLFSQWIFQCAMVYQAESKILQYFSKVRQFHCSQCFCWGRQDDKPHYTARCLARLILFEYNFFNFDSTIFFVCPSHVIASFELIKHKSSKFDHVAHSSVWLSNHTLNKSLYYVSTHQLPSYYLPKWIPTKT